MAEMKFQEEARLAALRQTQLLDSPPEPLFDLITGLAAKAVNVPIVLMSLVDADRQFFKSQCGLPSPWAEERQTPLTYSFCQYVAVLGEAFVVEDARVHPLVRDNPAVAEAGVIAYAGMPLITDDGFTLGSLCAIDTKPRQWTTAELEILRDFARQIMEEISIRTRLNRLDRDLGTLRASASEQRLQTRHIVHDLRTPLNALYLGLDGLAMMGELNGEQRTCLELVRKNASVLSDLVHKLIEIGAAEEKKAAPRTACAPNELIQRALDQVATLAQKAGIQLDYERGAALPPVFAHPDELTRVLVNLIANGVKFTPRGGKVTVSISEEIGHRSGVIRFSVTDTGIGIAPNDHDRIFREGVRLNETADRRQSSGIGLAFCKHVIEQHGGELTLESTPGVGSTFSFTLPIDRNAQPSDRAAVLA